MEQYSFLHTLLVHLCTYDLASYYIKHETFQRMHSTSPTLAKLSPVRAHPMESTRLEHGPAAYRAALFTEDFGPNSQNLELLVTRIIAATKTSDQRIYKLTGHLSPVYRYNQSATTRWLAARLFRHLLGCHQREGTAMSPPHLPLKDIIPSTTRPFLSLPDVIRERIYFFVLTPGLDPQTPWITPLPILRHTPKELPLLPPVPDCSLDSVSKSVRKKRRRRMRAYEKVKRDAILAVQEAAPSTCLAILATCRTILLEAFHIWYKYNTLNFTRVEDLKAFLFSIGRARQNEIRSIRLDLPGLEWDDNKARFALSRLLRLESLTFVYNAFSAPWLTHTRYISSPKIINSLRGLRNVTFVNPDNPISDATGYTQGMSVSVMIRMEQLRQELVSPPKRPKEAPPMIDLFSSLRVKDQSANGAEQWAWDEGLSYAPDIGIVG